jgi:hypothetical protein
MAEYLQAPPRRKALGLLADALTSGQEALNTVNLPYVGGLGGLLFGQAPQYLQDVSYGMPAFRGGNAATGGLGTFTPDTRMLDVATLPFVGAGAAKAGQVGAKTLGKEVARQVETGTGLIGSNVLDPRQFATAYHGSPYLFEQFDPTKVGSGVGKNAFGQGTYFSESQDVAKEYLAPKANSSVANFLYKDKPINPNNEAQRSAAFALNYFNGDKAQILNMYKPSYFESSSGKQFKKYIENMDIADIKPAGTLYKVDIPDKDIPKMIAWDKPIKDQPEVFNLIKSNIKDEDILKTFEHNAEKGITGSNAYSNYISGKTDTEKSKNALELGIKGIKYLDPKYINKDFEPYIQNYVVFNPEQVKILEKGLLK